ncbi:hypothetical protein ASPCAL02431 [Aspergillus calidoustus]|uniref:DUF5648 domain-containing protein n=1 Tax=Aspergillus calidoustus TaxID=454130 RepID=A0A0U5GQ98_ASPCI|nr:hypothetical protein ASPCAL02431 [Aspergillus calidoustus]
MVKYSNLFALITAAFGVTAAAAPTTSPSTPQPIVSLYRAFNPRIHDHFYTTNLAEYTNAVQNLGYSAEQTACRIHSTEQWATVPLYRLYSGSRTDHFYTTSAAERDSALQNSGYSDEGIAGYIYPADSSLRLPGLTPLYRLYSQQVMDHFFTVSQAERDNTIGRLGYYDEGIAGYVFPPE